MSRAWIPDVPRHLSHFLYASRWIGALFLLLAHAAIMVMNTGVMASFPKPVIFLQSLLFGPEFCIAIVNGLLVTSGFLVGGSVLAAVLEGRRFLSDYLIHRFARTYLVLVPAILLTCGFDGAGSVVPNAVPVYANEEFGGHWAPGVVLATLFNLQGIGADYLGTNGHLWIFAYDFWFCTLFALALLPWAKPYSRFARAAGFTVAVTLFALLSFPRGLYLGLLFVVFALGAAATLPARPFVRSKGLALLLCIGVGFALQPGVLGETLGTSSLLRSVWRLVFATSFANLLLTLRFSDENGWRFLMAPTHKRLARFSFTLCAIHTPIIMFLLACIYFFLGSNWRERLGGGAQVLALLGVMSAVTFASIGVSRLTEAKIAPARRWLRRLVDRLGARHGLSHGVRADSI